MPGRLNLESQRGESFCCLICGAVSNDALIQPYIVMKKVVCQNDANTHRLAQAKKSGRDSVWCVKFGYFIDLDACRARSYQKSVCRKCYPSLLQVPLPFEAC